MDDNVVVRILNELLTLEQRSLAVRLLESTVFLSPLSAAEMELVRRMAQTDTNDAARLVEAIIEHGGVPGPRIPDTDSADLHFQELHHLLPRLIAQREALIRKYDLAARRLSGEREAAGLISRILDRHRDELASLRQLAAAGVPAGR